MEKVVNAWVKQVLTEVGENFQNEFMPGLIKRSTTAEDLTFCQAIDALYSLSVAFLDLRKKFAETALEQGNIRPATRNILEKIADVDYLLADIQMALDPEAEERTVQ